MLYIAMLSSMRYTDLMCDLIVSGYSFLNQARTWFLRIASVHESLHACAFAYVCVRVCPPPRPSITSGVMWCNIDPTGLVK